MMFNGLKQLPDSMLDPSLIDLVQRKTGMLVNNRLIITKQKVREMRSGTYEDNRKVLQQNTYEICESDHESDLDNQQFIKSKYADGKEISIEDQLLHISSLKGYKDRWHARQVIQAASRNILITDIAIEQASNYSVENFLAGGHESCGEILNQQQVEWQRERRELNWAKYNVYRGCDNQQACSVASLKAASLSL